MNLSETAAAGAIAGADANATDADNDTVTFSLVGRRVAGGYENALFAIDSSTGQIRLTAAGAAAIDYSLPPRATC